MIGTTARRLLALSLVFAIAGCGARVAPLQPQEQVADAAAQSPKPSEPSSPPASSAVSPSTPSSPGEELEPSARPSATASPSFGPRHNNGVVRITLSANCVTPGTLLVVTLQTPPKAGLGMIIGYSDSQAHGAMNTGESDSTGSYVWRVPVSPTVPDGEARVLVTSTGANWEGDGGTADATFTVARRCPG